MDSECDLMNGHHIPTIEELDNGILLLNDFDGIIFTEDQPQRLNGTYTLSTAQSASTNKNIFQWRKQTFNPLTYNQIQKRKIIKKYSHWK